MIESEGMAKKRGDLSFELKSPEKDKKIGTPDEIRTHDLLLRRQTLFVLKIVFFIENVAEMWHLLFDIHFFCDTLRKKMKQWEAAA